MSLQLELTIALKYLKSKKKEAFISITSMLSLLGIAIGVASLIVVISVMNGYREELSIRLRGVNSDIAITTVNQRSKIEDYQEIEKVLGKMDGIKSVFPVLSEQALLSNQYNNALGVLVKAIPDEKIKLYPLLSLKRQYDDFGLIVGSNAAKSMGVRLGSNVKITSLHFNSTIIGSIPNSLVMPVTAIFSSGLSYFDGLYAFMPLSKAQKLFRSRSVNRIEIFLSSGANLEQVTEKIDNLIGAKYFVNNWKYSNQAILKALETERTVMFIILTLIIIVAAFNVVSSLTMLVIDKNKEIAILKTIGMSKKSIISIFMITGLILGVVGTGVGAILGILLAMNINSIKEFLSNISGTNLFDPVVYYLDLLPSKIDYFDTSVICITTLIVSFFATLYPALRAAKINPMEGLKND